MARRKLGARVLGPWPHKRRGRVVGWRVVSVDEQGRRSPDYFGTKKKAEAYAAILRAKLSREDRLGAAITAYEKSMVAKGNKEKSAETTARRLRAFFADEHLPLPSLTIAGLRRVYERRRTEVAVDTHRNELAESKTFLRWAYSRGLVSKALVDRLDDVKGIGKRRKGKKQLRIDEARLWTARAVELAEQEPGAVAAMCCFLLGLRSCEVVGMEARDVDDGGRLLWADAKTDAGKRCIEIPDLLQPHLLRLSKGKQGDERVFGRHWRDWPRDWVKRICRQVGVPEVTAHGMRGLHATLAIKAGASSHVVAASLGHASPTVTEQHYTKPDATAAARQGRVLKVIEGGRK